MLKSQYKNNQSRKARKARLESNPDFQSFKGAQELARKQPIAMTLHDRFYDNKIVSYKCCLFPNKQMPTLLIWHFTAPSLIAESWLKKDDRHLEFTFEVSNVPAMPAFITAKLDCVLVIKKK